MHEGGFGIWDGGGGEGRCTREGLLNGVGGVGGERRVGLIDYYLEIWLALEL